MQKYNWKNIALFIVAVISSIVFASFIWQLTFEPYFTNQLKTLTWFGVLVMITAGTIAYTAWSEFLKNGK